MGRLKSNIHGVGINDVDGVIYKKDKDTGLVWRCPVYARWEGMLRRCHTIREKRHNNYLECYVCDEWLLFSNFKSWMEKQDWTGSAFG